MNFAADPLYVSQRDEAALLGLFRVRVAEYNHQVGVGGCLHEQKGVFAQKEGSAAPGSSRPSRTGMLRWVNIPARHSRGHRLFPDVAAKAAGSRHFLFNSLNTVFEGKLVGNISLNLSSHLS